MPKIIYSPEHRKFSPSNIYDARINELVKYADTPDTVDAILHALEELSWPVIRESGDYKLDPYFGSHDGEMIALFREVDQGISSGLLESPVVPSQFAVRRLDRLPDALDGRLGWYCTDVRTPLSAGFWAAACGSLSATIAGANLLLEGERLAYVLARPSGHGAGRDFFGGGSYLNYAAGAVTQLSRRSKVAVLEIGFHHGSGTQDIFSAFRDVLFASVHVDPSSVYPYYSGYSDQHGDAKRDSIQNLTISFPLEPKRFVNAVRNAVGEVKRTRPGTLIVSLGTDLCSAEGSDRALAGMSLPLSVYAEAGSLVGSLRIPTLVIQEDGRETALAGDAVREFLQALQAAGEQK